MSDVPALAQSRISLRAERSSTIGTERLTNYALQIKSKEEFVRQLTSNLPARPDYFSQDAEMNRSGATALSELPELPVVDAMRLKTMLEDGEVALDIRTDAEFCAGHVPGSINIALSGQFASWAGAVLGLIGIFLPGILILLGTLPFWETFRKRAGAQAVMRGIMVAEKSPITRGITASALAPTGVL